MEGGGGAEGGEHMGWLTGNGESRTPAELVGMGEWLAGGNREGGLHAVGGGPHIHKRALSGMSPSPSPRNTNVKILMEDVRGGLRIMNFCKNGNLDGPDAPPLFIMQGGSSYMGGGVLRIIWCASTCCM